MVLHDSVAVVVFLTRLRAQQLAMITTRKSIHGFPLRSFMGMGLLLAVLLGRRAPLLSCFFCNSTYILAHFHTSVYFEYVYES